MAIKLSPNSTTLSLDPSLRWFGWSVFSRGKLIAYGCISSKHRSGVSRKNDTEDLTHIADELLKVIIEYKIKQVYSEDFGGSQSAQAAKTLGYVKGLVIGICKAKKIPAQYINPDKVKEALTNNKSAEKIELANICYTKFPTLKSEIEKMAKDRIFAITDSIAVYLSKSQEIKNSVK